MGKKKGLAITIVMVIIIVVLGFTTLFQKEKNDGNQELTYVEEQNNQSIEDEFSGEVTFVTEKEDPLEQKEDRTKQEGAEETVIEEKEMTEEELIRKWFEEWYNSRREETQWKLAYLLSEPCHFVITVNHQRALDSDKYRNIDGDMDPGFMYIADIVIDKYIRDYGGEEGVYSIEYSEEFAGDMDLYGVHILEISNKDTKLKIIRDGYTSLVCVYIVNAELEEVTEFEKMSYIYWERIRDDYRTFKNDVYWLFIDKEFRQKEYHYRNVNPSSEDEKNSILKCDERGYYVADVAIDKYIRDYGGKNSLYNVELIEKEEDKKNGGYRYVLFIENAEDSEQQIQIEYSDADWLVTVKVPDGKERLLKYWGIKTDE